MQLLDELRKLKSEKNLLNGTLFWTIDRQKVRDVTGDKGWHFAVCFHVKSDEDYFTEDEIRAEIEHVKQQMKEQRDEFFIEEPENDS